MDEFVEFFSSMARSAPFILLLLGTGLFLTIKLAFIQFRLLKPALKILFDKNTSASGEVSSYKALFTVLSGTIGTGNIAGVATAITLGGPGAVFWMWVTALVGMATKFASCTLAHRFREKNKSGEYVGGPMYTLKNGLNMPKLGACFAFFVLLAALTTGGMVQANSVVHGVVYIFPDLFNHKLILGLILTVLVGLVVLGGVKRIASVAALVVPFMAISYCSMALIILIYHWESLPVLFSTIITAAFNPEAIGGGTLGAAIQYGIVRGLFACEAGLGTAPIGLAAAKSEKSVEVGLAGMLGPWVDTMIICSMTAMVIILAGLWGDAIPSGMQGAALSSYAFEQGMGNISKPLGSFGPWIVGFGLIVFAYTTMLAWAYYGDKAAEYLWGTLAIKPFRTVFLASLVAGALNEVAVVWSLADVANVLMAIPNLISVILLSGLVKSLLDAYLGKKKEAAPSLVPEED